MRTLDEGRTGPPEDDVRMRRFMDDPGAGTEAPSGTGSRRRDVEVIQLLAVGKSDKQVAAALNVSTRTIESHRNYITHKMEFKSFSELVRFAVRNSLVEA
jgi:DNA-binding NarL/FixJ family response regulator